MAFLAAAHWTLLLQVVFCKVDVEDAVVSYIAFLEII